MWKSMLIGLTLSAVAPLQVAAQVYLEVGGAIGRASESGGDELRATGWQAGVWVNEKTAVRFRYLQTRRPDLVFQLGDDVFRRSDETKELWLGEITWHFGAPRVARIFAGVSLGARTFRSTTMCASGDCDGDPFSGPPIGRTRTPFRQTWAGVAGASFHPTRRLVIVAQLGLHDFPGDIGSAVISLHAIYRHPLRR